MNGRPFVTINRRLNRWRHRLRVVGAMLLLALLGIAQKLIPMPRWSRILGRVGEVPPAWRGSKVGQLPYRSSSVAETRVARSVARAVRALPWTPTCLAEAAAGQVLLRLAGSPGVVVIGLKRTEPETTGPWDAHAWLMGASGSLTGGAAASGFTATTVYEVPGALRARDINLEPIPRSG